MWNSQATEFNEAAMSINTNKPQKHNSEQKKVHIVWFHLCKIQNQTKAK